MSNVISFTGQKAIVSFCVKFNLHDPAAPALTANYLYTPVSVGVDFNNNFGITEIVQDEEDKFGAEAFLCDDQDNPISNPETKNQGATVRVCVQPDAFTRPFGVAMKSINSFRLARGDVDQDVIIPNGVIQNLQTTQYKCTAGQRICSLATVVGNDFYYSKGEVFGTGDAWLQYQYGIRRKLIRVPIKHRRARVAGGFVGSRPFEISFLVEPSEARYEAIAFECNSRNQPVDPDKQEEPKSIGDTIRVCVTPNQAASDRGVYIRDIASFVFKQGENVQFAVEPTGRQASDGNTIMICNSGDPVCAFKTVLSAVFFQKKDPVVGEGEIHLQFGPIPMDPPIQRRARVVFQRQVQTTDAGFAGLAEVAVGFNVNNVPKSSYEMTWQDKAEEWWKETPIFLRIIYILAILVALGILFCFLWAIFCGIPFRSEKDLKNKRDSERRSTKVFVQPAIVKPERPKEEVYEEVPCVDDMDFQKPASPAKRNSRFVPCVDDMSFDTNQRSTTAAPQTPPDSPQASVLKLENSVASSPKPATTPGGGRKSKKSTSKSPKRSSTHTATSAAVNEDDNMSARSGSSARSRKSTRSKNSTMSGRESTARSPRPGRKRTSEMKSPGGRQRSSVATGGSSSMAGESQSTTRSPKLARKSSVRAGGSSSVAGSSVRTPKQKRRTLEVPNSAPAGRASASVTSSVRTPRSARSSTGRKSAGGRRAAIEKSSSRRSRAPDAPPFILD